MTSPARKLLRNNKDTWPLQVVRRGYRKRLFGLLATGAAMYQKLYFNADYFNMQQNGEELVIRAACEELGASFVAFDVGANRGDWAAAVKTVSPNATVHCFEPAPSMVEALTTRFDGVSGVVVRPFGLSDKSGPVTFTTFPRADAVGSIHPLPWSDEREVITVDVETGIGYVTAEGIEAVSFLKVDAEGHDLAVLRGFGDFLRGDHVRVIQFEYGRMFVASRVLLGDFYELLEQRGYAVGRLHPRGVAFKAYDPLHDENFLDGNYIAVHRTLGKLVERVAHP
jgi:FkbM family methyltransferase